MIISNSFQEFNGAQVTLLDEGWDFRVFELDSSWIFRFPKHKGAVSKLKMETKLLSDLKDWLPLPIPNYEYYEESFNGTSIPFAGYRKLPGDPGDICKSVDLDRVSQQLGNFLGRLHAYPMDRIKEAGVKEQYNYIAHWAKKSLEQLSRLKPLSVDKDHLRRYLLKRIPQVFHGAPSLTHNDLWAEHILIDPDTGGVSGIIDWGDAMLGDSAVDFATLYASYGATWLENVISHYSRPLDAAIISRSRFLAACFSIHTITLGQELKRPRWIRAGNDALQRIVIK